MSSRIINIDQKIFEPKILVFACNWCSYAGADNAGISRIEYSPNVRLLRTMCSGRVHPSFVLKAFAEGADGVIVSGCHFGDCHYMFGNYKAEEQYKRLTKIIKILGIDQKRIALEWISAAEGPRFASVINNFVDAIKEIGPINLVASKRDSSNNNDLNLNDYKLYQCLECGRCTSICPVAKTQNFSPRRLVSQGISKGEKSISSDPSVWACLSCKLCEEVCPSDIPYSEMNIRLRSLSKELGVEKTCTHGGVFEQISKIMSFGKLDQKRLSWLTDDLKVNQADSDTLFYTGCSPYFSAYFDENYTEKLTGSLQAAVKLMNRIGVVPKILANEMCCGNDLLLRGELNEFKDLSKIISEQIKNSNVKRVVFICPECLVTFRDEYPKHIEKLDVELIHLSELLVSHFGKLKFKSGNEKVTYQDPCRLGRYSGLYEQPREIIREISGIELMEMEHNKDKSICCGNTAWINCNCGTNEIQKKRLSEAVNTGSEKLLTACPKCLIHLTCSQNGKEEFSNNKIEVSDIWNYLASHLD